jgi:hypothetical protein
MQDPDYERLFHERHATAVQSLVDVAYERACGPNGKERSDRLMIKLLESIPPTQMMPFGWQFNATRRHKVRGPSDAPINATVSARDLLKG